MVDLSITETFGDPPGEPTGLLCLFMPCFCLSIFPDSPASPPDSHFLGTTPFIDKIRYNLNDYSDDDSDTDDDNNNAMNLTAITTLLNGLLSTYDKKRRPGEGGKTFIS